MEIWQLGLILGSLLASCGAFIWSVIYNGSNKSNKKHSKEPVSYTDTAEKEIEHLFSETFREELRNRGRLHFEKIISENAMFLQQDLRLTTSQLNEFLKEEVTKKLQQEFVKYEESINDAKHQAVEAISKTQTSIEKQHEEIRSQLKSEFSDEKSRMIKHFEENMATILNHYVMTALGDHVDITKQIDFVISGLEENKQAIINDIADGA